MEGYIRDRIATYSVGTFTIVIPFAVARKADTDLAQYALVTATGPDVPAVRYLTTLNSTSPAELSPDGKPVLWVVPDVEPTQSQAPGSTLDALLAQPWENPPLQLMGGTRSDAGTSYGRALQAELLLEEDALLRVCCYCGSMENANWPLSDRYERCDGSGYTSLYWCSKCAGKTFFGRALTSLGRRVLSLTRT
ncbi:hypothetical protein PUNSTDRAFT_52337 [Punctularia strigosozonata HHB-11173 SS5]|uniref:uncharacterized protein n=1 Tax=Punctularia strigosozonata (strain HHB-11173) TaxID=741275 RepID=UPI00044168BB|nr:uncharacterized protein PUNSTDRAFT_52337 [Punctularia strigosozonata HHB-11173 SS5]EIN08871.1 hypothetical protein PUNSTDRAFT_52337 [Punctularia strigosozonata HHB-11173 SS5]